ncbi:MAG TPA: hypothetical protein ENH91_14680 [Leeuwenhoekiella sp.]|nr:hypothetical protein [Leeuwenhoekiella sp.]
MFKRLVRKKNRHADYYSANLKNINSLSLPQHTKNNDYHSWHLYVIKLKERNALLQYLKEKGIQCGIHYPNALLYQAY